MKQTGIHRYASYTNGKTPKDWQVTEDVQKPRYGRLLFVKNRKVLLTRERGKPWKLPGLLLGHLVDQEEELKKWAKKSLGIRIDQFDNLLGLFTIGVRRGIDPIFEYRETMVHIPSCWWQEKIQSREKPCRMMWHTFDTPLQDLSMAARDFLQEYREDVSTQVACAG